jgi:NAD(P)-dependent dehydrogenase (short-subunit alcohol dehydrogenase family)
MAFVVDPDLLGLVDKVALVVGSGPGIGRACAVQLARAGCHVAMADIRTDYAAANVALVEGLGRRATFIQADALNADQMRAMVDKVFTDFGRMDVAVNVVAGGDSGPTSFLDYTEDAWDRVISGTLKTTFLCCQAEAIRIIQHKIAGSIINIGSTAGVSAAPTLSAYGAGKAAVAHLTKTVAVELASYDVRVNCVIPGNQVVHEGQRRGLEAPDVLPEFKEYMATRGSLNPMGRPGEQMETAGVVLFFASKLSSYVTGHSLASDGGVTHTNAKPPFGLDMKPLILSRVP